MQSRESCFQERSLAYLVLVQLLQTEMDVSKSKVCGEVCIARR